MSYIFMDESGDLGFDFMKSRTSKYFIITFVFSAKKEPIEKVVKKVFKSLIIHGQKKHSGCLHAVKEKPKTRIKLLSMLNNQDISIITIYLNKKKTHKKMQNEKHVLYNYIAKILLDRVCSQKLIPIDGEVHLVASQRETNKFLNENFKQCLQKQVENNHKISLLIEIKPPHAEKCLQAADFVCWAINRKIEYNDDSYESYIKSKIVEKSQLFL